MHSTIDTVLVKHSALLTIQYTARKTKVSTFPICNSDNLTLHKLTNTDLVYTKISNFHCTSFLQATLGHIFSDMGSLDRVFKIFTNFKAFLLLTFL